MKYADLHAHTFYSDSTFSPVEVVSYARKKGLAAVAICDHDSVDGIGPAEDAGADLGVEVIASVELTVENPNTEIHILGYFIDWRQGWFRKKLEEIRQFRVDRIYKMVKKLNDVNIGIEALDVLSLAGRGAVGRPHLARAMVNAGHVKDMKEAFAKYIGFGLQCYVPKMKLSDKETIDMILKAGGVPVLAHSNLMGDDGLIPPLVACGLRGIEVYHTEHSASMVRHYEALAKVYGLLITGGSDCHGMNKARPLLGTVRVPYILVERLKEESERIRRDCR